MVEVKDIHISFNDTEILKGVDTSFEKGKTNLIIGRSGSGKTVFLKCLLGLFTPDQGEILFENRDIGRMSFKEKKRLREEMGMVFQYSALFDSMTVIENVQFPLDLFTNESKSQKKKRAQEVLERVDLHDAENKYPAEISGGMRKRVAIARAIVNSPKYLFCDEPNSGLDPKTANIIDNLIQDITREYNTTTIINTHDMNSVLEIGETILYLKEGKKVWTGSHNEILTSDNEDMVDFVYSSNLFKKVRNALRKGSN